MTLMAECITDAIVIDKEESGEQDARVFLYTEALGSVVAKATSIRKITSKLATHLEPLNVIKVRLIERSTGGSTGYQIGDALLHHRSLGWRASPEALAVGLRLAHVFKESGFRGDPDPEMWNMLSEMFGSPPTPPFTAYTSTMLGILGFDPRYAECSVCAHEHPTQFSFRALAFFCDACLPAGQACLPAGRLAPSETVRLC